MPFRSRRRRDGGTSSRNAKYGRRHDVCASRRDPSPCPKQGRGQRTFGGSHGCSLTRRSDGGRTSLTRHLDSAFERPEHFRRKSAPLLRADATRLNARTQLVRRPMQPSFRRRARFQRRKDLVEPPCARRLRTSGARQTTRTVFFYAEGAFLPPGRSSFVGRCSPPSGVARAFDGGRTWSHDRDQRAFARRKHLRRREQRSFARQEHVRRRGQCSFARKERFFHPDAARSSTDAALLPSVARPSDDGRTSSHGRVQHAFGRKDHSGRRRAHFRRRKRHANRR
jgi:hypothetical protein